MACDKYQSSRVWLRMAMEQPERNDTAAVNMCGPSCKPVNPRSMPFLLHPRRYTLSSVLLSRIRSVLSKNGNGMTFALVEIHWQSEVFGWNFRSGWQRPVEGHSHTPLGSSYTLPKAQARSRQMSQMGLHIHFREVS
jgi:hypothetical protein